jgi:hypothetical protein
MLQAHLSLGSWGALDLYRAEDILNSVGSNKRKRAILDDGEEDEEGRAGASK